jgi:O-antigen/teichoic acid export membrane protein
MSAATAIGSKLIHLALNVIATLAIIRYLGPASFGDYVFIFSVAALFGLLSDFGITKVAVREMARRPDSAPKYLGTSIAARLVLSVVALAAAEIVLAAIGARPAILVGVAIAALLFTAEAALSVTAVFQVRLAMQYEALVILAIQSLDTAAILWLISVDAGLLPILAAPVVSTLLGLVLAWYIARARFGVRVSVDRKIVVSLLREAWPLGVTTLLALLYLKADSVLLGVLATPRDVGLYGAAYRPVEYLFLALGMLINALFPLLSRWHGVDPTLFRTVYRRGNDALVAISLPVAVVVALLADTLVLALYAPDFAPAAAPLRVLTFGLVFMLVGAWQGFTLLAVGRQSVALACNGLGLTANLALNLMLIPSFGYVGASWAALATSVIVAVSTTLAVRAIVGVDVDLARTTRLSLTSAAVGLVLWTLVTASVPWPIAAFAAGTAYPLMLIVFRAASRSELRLLIPVRAQAEAP